MAPEEWYVSDFPLSAECSPIFDSSCMHNLSLKNANAMEQHHGDTRKVRHGLMICDVRILP